jgi:hypothetical protein
MTEDMSRFPLALDGPGRPMVWFAHVTKRHGSLTVLDDPNLDIAGGEMVATSGRRARARPRCCGC